MALCYSQTKMERMIIMNYQHESIDSMLRYMHDAIKRDCERHILINQPASTHSKITIDVVNDVKYQNTQMILYAVKKINEYHLDKYNDTDDFVLVNAYWWIYQYECSEDITIWGETLRHFGKNYTEHLEVSKMLYIPRVLGGY